MIERRRFLKQTIGGSFLLATSSFPLSAFDNDPAITKLTILHTNDVHSRIDPFPMDGSRNEGLGGAAKRMKMIQDIRARQEHVILLDSGDIFQGTPYFNFFGGELEMKLMTKMGYDAGTMGNHDFDAGIEGFEKQMPLADFPFIVSNYNFDDTILHDKIDKYRIIEKAGIKIGLIGLGIELNELVPEKLYKKTVYEDPIAKAEYYGRLLKEDLKCDYVICLSHLGYKYTNDKVSDVVLAENTGYLDLILGGHTHTFMRKPDIRKNKNDQEVVINQAGWAGILLGQVNVYFEKNKKGKCISCKNSFVK
ncbi:metallophosphatase [Saprospiraceae bacterium]|nr:metallophosphatase [Saprospiraceae bacterium]